MALDCLANEDTAILPLESTLVDVFRERYALAVFYYSVLDEEQMREGLLAILKGSFTNENSICLWFGVDCHEDISVNSLDWSNVYVVSRIPTEIGLLSNMTKLSASEYSAVSH